MNSITSVTPLQNHADNYIVDHYNKHNSQTGRLFSVDRLPEDTFDRVLECFIDQNDINDSMMSLAKLASTPFKRQDLEQRRTVQKMKGVLDELSVYYLPCKMNKYMDPSELYEQRCITILRQILRLHQITLTSKQIRDSRGKKLMLYQISLNPEQKRLIFGDKTQHNIPIKISFT